MTLVEMVVFYLIFVVLMVEISVKMVLLFRRHFELVDCNLYTLYHHS